MGEVEIRRIGEEDRMIGKLIKGIWRWKIVEVFLIERIINGLVMIEDIMVIKGGKIEMGKRKNEKIEIENGRIDERRKERVDILIWKERFKVSVKIEILRRERRMVGKEEKVDREGRNVGIDLIVEIKMIIIGKNV